jgi:hypothetical protein
MPEAFLFGLAASSALVIGSVAGAFWRPPQSLVAVALAFASGSLITALAFDLFEESCKAGGAVLASLADTLMPDAYREGGGLRAFATAAGSFFVRYREHLSPRSDP